MTVVFDKDFESNIVDDMIKLWDSYVDKQIIPEIRKAFADYYKTEGCTYCQDIDGHEKANNRLGELLKSEKYEDGSGFDWHKYSTEDK